MIYVVYLLFELMLIFSIVCAVYIEPSKNVCTLPSESGRVSKKIIAYNDSGIERKPVLLGLGVGARGHFGTCTQKNCTTIFRTFLCG